MITKLPYKLAVGTVGAFSLISVALTGCTDDQNSSTATTTQSGQATVSPAPYTDPGTNETTASTVAQPGSTNAAALPDNGCYVQLFDSEDFYEGDSIYLITEPGKYPNLKGLPGTERDWTEQADSLKVGPKATVTIWTKVDFGGTSSRLEPGSQHPDLEDEPSSLELEC